MKTEHFLIHSLHHETFQSSECLDSSFPMNTVVSLQIAYASYILPLVQTTRFGSLDNHMKTTMFQGLNVYVTDIIWTSSKRLKKFVDNAKR